MKTIVGLLALISTPLSLSAAKSGGERSRSEISPTPAHFHEKREEQRQLIEIRKDRSLMFEGKLVTEDHLIRRIRGKVAQDRNVKLHIQGMPETSNRSWMSSIFARSVVPGISLLLPSGGGIDSSAGDAVPWRRAG